jgi:hypothetical protein
MQGLKLNRATKRRIMRGGGGNTNRNKNTYFGVPVQVVKMGNTHKIIRHKPKPIIGIYNHQTAQNDTQ